MHILTCNYNQNPNVGLFCYANDKYCLVPHLFPKKLKKEFEEVLQVPIYEIKAVGTDLLGVFLAGNDDCLLVPKIMFKTELQQLEKFKIKYKIINTELTALGNNLLIANGMCIANPDYNDTMLKEIKSGLKTTLIFSRISIGRRISWRCNLLGILLCSFSFLAFLLGGSKIMRELWK